MKRLDDETIIDISSIINRQIEIPYRIIQTESVSLVFEVTRPLFRLFSISSSLETVAVGKAEVEVLHWIERQSWEVCCVCLTEVAGVHVGDTPVEAGIQ